MLGTQFDYLQALRNRKELNTHVIIAVEQYLTPAKVHEIGFLASALGHNINLLRRENRDLNQKIHDEEAFLEPHGGGRWLLTFDIGSKVVFTDDGYDAFLRWSEEQGQNLPVFLFNKELLLTSPYTVLAITHEVVVLHGITGVMTLDLEYFTEFFNEVME